LTRGEPLFFFEIFHAGQACPAKMGRPFENGPWFPSDRIFFAPNVPHMCKAKRAMDAGQSWRNQMGRIQDSFALWHPIGPCAKEIFPNGIGIREQNNMFTKEKYKFCRRQAFAPPAFFDGKENGRGQLCRGSTTVQQNRTRRLRLV